MKKLIAVFAFLVLLTPQFAGAQACSGIQSCVCIIDGSTATASDSDVDLEGKTSTEAAQACNSFCLSEASGKEAQYRLDCDGATGTAAAVSAPENPEEQVNFNPPRLSIAIPGLNFTPTTLEGGFITSTYLGQYIAAIYRVLIGFVALASVIMIMVAGMQWMVARGNASQVQNATKLLGKAAGSLALVLSIYLIAFLIDPRTTRSGALRLQFIDQIVYQSISPVEGDKSVTAEASRCAEAEKKAKDEAPCQLPELLGSVTGSDYSCNYHFLSTKAPGENDDINYDYKKINALDYSATWDTPLKAPADGYVTYHPESSNRCGNKIRFYANDGQRLLTLCHVKDFTDENGAYLGDGGGKRNVSKGDTIGHMGGRCSSTVNPRDSVMKERGWCRYDGKVCSSPLVREADCQAQPENQSGRTSGPHAHLTWSGPGYLLSCVE